LDAITPARTAALNAPDRKPCLLAIVFPLPPSCFTHFATVVSVTADTGMDPNTGSISRVT